jgi:hypothetical protein
MKIYLNSQIKEKKIIEVTECLLSTQSGHSKRKLVMSFLVSFYLPAQISEWPF